MIECAFILVHEKIAIHTEFKEQEQHLLNVATEHRLQDSGCTMPPVWKLFTNLVQTSTVHNIVDVDTKKQRQNQSQWKEITHPVDW